VTSAIYRPTQSFIASRVYDREPELAAAELDGLGYVMTGHGGTALEHVLAKVRGCERLIRPLNDALDAASGDPWWKLRALLALLRGCAEQNRAYWGWDALTWRLYLSPVRKGTEPPAPDRAVATFSWSPGARQYMVAAAYLLGVMPDPLQLPDTRWLRVAEKVFGPEKTSICITAVDEAVSSWGYAWSSMRDLRSLTGEALIRCGHADLARIAEIDLAAWRQAEPYDRRGLVYLLSRALTKLGVLREAIEMDSTPRQPFYIQAAEREVHPEWVQWVERWFNTSTISYSTRRSVRADLLKIGRWLARGHANITSPQQWDRSLCAAAVAAITRMRVGDFTSIPTRATAGPVGRPMSPRSHVAVIQALRLFFRDLQEWEWIPRRFTPARAIAIPRSIKALIGPKPRPIANDRWAKLVWAGLNIGPEDLPRFGRDGDGRTRTITTYYPEPMIRALTVVWLFSGLRSDEIIRLRCGCVRWQEEDVAVPGRPGDILARDAVCMLDVPVNKTGTAFTKPVDPVVGRAIAAWEGTRPEQPALRDRKTGELVHFLFCHRARRLQKSYLNETLIPALCEKAGVPIDDEHGRLTSHRARTTIASQLYNAKDPMTLFELQAWLGHASPHSTQHYAKLTPLTLAKAYTDAGYFARNIRAIEVLIDRDAVQSGATVAGSPWQYFDVGHGYCTYSFFEQCPHRMACPRCDFYVPKGSSKAQLLEAKTNLQRMLIEIPLTEEERAAVEDGHAAVDRLLERLADVPTPSGRTPRQLKQLPVLQSESVRRQEGS
jgi:integrase